MEIRKKIQKDTKVTLFFHKIKTKAQTKNLRHTSLDKIVLYTLQKMCIAGEILSEIFMLKK